MYDSHLGSIVAKMHSAAVHQIAILFASAQSPEGNSIAQRTRIISTCILNVLQDRILQRVKNSILLAKRQFDCTVLP